MNDPTREYLMTMLTTFSLTVDEARQKRICVECGRCASRSCQTTASWTTEQWADYELTAFCPTCVVTETDRVNRALDRTDKDNDERNWADLSTMPADWGNDR